eukprot:CAMPEP_0176193290 /NCGR_PEP_ID=MMETSP0121_2-20121125/5409_1 /TAXON_ID=160619 /ORGANISM="Kryptoperidinium foliaceum, Strain CCMP 1326" /LENGTH=558 /DNA_ID=CAMNT_0017532001 /DNA_START=48 /DNA_END=1721 /DNA_ORIENTATION=+
MTQAYSWRCGDAEMRRSIRVLERFRSNVTLIGLFGHPLVCDLAECARRVHAKIMGWVDDVLLDLSVQTDAAVAADSWRMPVPVAAVAVPEVCSDVRRSGPSLSLVVAEVWAAAAQHLSACLPRALQLLEFLRDRGHLSLSDSMARIGDYAPAVEDRLLRAANDGILVSFCAPNRPQFCLALMRNHADSAVRAKAASALMSTYSDSGCTDDAEKSLHCSMIREEVAAFCMSHRAEFGRACSVWLAMFPTLRNNARPPASREVSNSTRMLENRRRLMRYATLGPSTPWGVVAVAQCVGSSTATLLSRAEQLLAVSAADPAMLVVSARRVRETMLVTEAISREVEETSSSWFVEPGRHGACAGLVDTELVDLLFEETARLVDPQVLDTLRQVVDELPFYFDVLARTRLVNILAWSTPDSEREAIVAGVIRIAEAMPEAEDRLVQVSSSIDRRLLLDLCGVSRPNICLAALRQADPTPSLFPVVENLMEAYRTAECEGVSSWFCQATQEAVLSLCLLDTWQVGEFLDQCNGWISTFPQSAVTDLRELGRAFADDSDVSSFWS